MLDLPDDADRVRSSTHDGGRTAAVVALSVLALALWTARATQTGPRFGWFLWNLGLAWVPWLAARTLRWARGAVAIAAIAGVWLLFLPNAPYLVTDLIHLRARPPVPLWFDVLFFSAFALAGCALGWSALEEVHARLARAIGPSRAAAVVAGVLLLVGFGVYLGRFGRWNSWDALAQPWALAAAAARAVATPRAVVFSLLFGLHVGAGYLLVVPARSPQRDARLGGGLVAAPRVLPE